MPRNDFMSGFSTTCLRAWDRFGFDCITYEESNPRKVDTYDAEKSTEVCFRDIWISVYHNKFSIPSKWNDYSTSPTTTFNLRRSKRLRKRHVHRLFQHTIETSNFLGICKWRQNFKTLSRNFRRRRRLQAANKLNELKEWVPELSPIVASYL